MFLHTLIFSIKPLCNHAVGLSVYMLSAPNSSVAGVPFCGLDIPFSGMMVFEAIANWINAASATG